MMRFGLSIVRISRFLARHALHVCRFSSEGAPRIGMCIDPMQFEKLFHKIAATCHSLSEAAYTCCLLGMSVQRASLGLRYHKSLAYSLPDLFAGADIADCLCLSSTY